MASQVAPQEIDKYTLNRQLSKTRLYQQTEPWDLLVIGGGATGIAIALDAAVRGLSVALVERSDFGKGTSSRSTKLVHGGVRYLRQGNITLVRDALHERERLRVNSPNIVTDLPFVIPCGGWFEQLYYAIGLKLYDWLATKSNFGRSRRISGTESQKLLPNIQATKLNRGVVYHDGQFDDARLLIAMARTAAAKGACLINYVAATGFDKDDSGKLVSVRLQDLETGESFQAAARCFINAAGPFCDEVRELDQPDAAPLLKVSQGVHLVLSRQFFPGEAALMVPRTDDGRVLFIIPWHDYVLIGTTDTEIPKPLAEPQPTNDEIQFLLQTAGRYLVQQPKLSDVLSMFTGIRPLVKDDRSARTASLSRDHVIRVAPSGLITITGGKWTTVRKMAEDCVDRVYKELGVSAPPCPTKNLKLWDCDWEKLATDESSERQNQVSLRLSVLGGLGHTSPDPDPTHAFVLNAVRKEMARTVEDVLARRSRLLFCDARRAIAIAPQVAQWLAAELQRDDSWQADQVSQFETVAKCYVPTASLP
jgi:glycerol-3-phosphate dehydrogenase